MALACAALALPVAAPAQNAELSELHVERGEEGLLLSARLALNLPAPVQEALHTGIPIHFVTQARVMRQRWYWYDQTLADAHRYTRLAYLPLTRRWRVNTGAQPLAESGQGVSLVQHYDSLEEAMSAVGRVARWNIASADDIAPGGQQRLHFQFRLDASQLPRSLQLGAAAQSDWTVALQRQLSLSPEGS